MSGSRRYSKNLVSSRKARFEMLEDRRLLSTFMVTNTSDGGSGSLRQAILDANAKAGTDAIEFNIGGGGVQTIRPGSALPTITDPVVIDGTTQPGFAGMPIIELDGSSAAGAANGLDITAGNSTVRALVVNRFAQNGILLSGGAGSIVEGCFVGTDVTGSTAQPNGLHGIAVWNSRWNRIGTNGDGVGDTSERNTISGNASFGVNLGGQSAEYNVVAGNSIGTDVTGSSPLGNHIDGVVIGDGARFNLSSSKSRPPQTR